MAQAKKVIDEGTESTVVSTVRDDGTAVIIKHRQPQGKTHYLFEAYAYTAVGALGSHVPTVVDVDENELIISAFLGETLDDQIELYDDARLLDEVAKDLALNRKVVFEGYGRPILDSGVYRGEYSSWHEFLMVTFDKLQRSELLSETQKAFLILEWDNVVNDIKLDHGVLVHGDFALSAIFVRNKEYEGIIDYGDAFIGDPLLDLAYFRYKEITKEYGYKLYDTLSDSYAKYSGASREYIDKIVPFYMIYWAIERSHADNLPQELVVKFIEKAQVLINAFMKGTR